MISDHDDSGDRRVRSGGGLRSSALGQDPPHRSPADPQPPRDLGLAHALGFEAVDLVDLQRCRWRTSVGAAFLPGLGDPGSDPLAEDLAFELREDCQHPRHRAARRRGQVERLGQ